MHYRKIQFEDLDKACNIWFLQQRSKGAPISGPLLQEKALQLFPKLYPHHEVGTFKGSSGWLHKFCRRHGICAIQLQGESLLANTSAIQPFKCDLLKIIEIRGYTKDQIFNADETVLKELTIQHSVYWAAQAWSETTTDCLSRGWNNLLRPDDNMMTTRGIDSDAESAEISGLFQELGSSDTEDWLKDDYLDPGFEIITDEEIVSHVQNERTETELDPDSDNEQFKA
ncbi:Jerky protein homolog-like [Oopsacas minuta]|uniref:Jerky protein homolog-like n=1 Tax=Oopsacas minuta TaxID=111878 RepID=A0AAV7K524_9METZ|nr:Jerky protein homolog-like [Oopsacas minuta]